MSWEPVIVTDPLKEKSIKLIDTITEALDGVVFDEKTDLDYSLGCGRAGISLYYAQISKLKKGEYLQKALVLIEDCLNSIGQTWSASHSYSLCNGPTGIAWSTNYLITEGFIEADSDELFKDLDEELFKYALYDLSNGSYDLLHSSLGVGIYLLDRLQNPLASGYLSELVKTLEKISHKNEKWEDKDQFSDKTNSLAYNIGLAHGIPSILIFLSRVYSSNIEKDLCEKLITKSIKWLIAQKLPENMRSIYSSKVLQNKYLSPSNLAWCYGDLGIAITLWQAGTCLEIENWKNQALEILFHAAKRRNLEENSIIDGCICHGAAGVAHIFNHFYQLTKDSLLRDTSLYWYTQLFKFNKHKDGLAGFKVFNPLVKKNPWVNEVGIIEGVVGIGLSLVSAVSYIPPKWDKVLLIS